MSRSEGSARPPYPPDALGNVPLGSEVGIEEWWAALEQTLWPILEGEVIQPHCMCGRFSTVGECPRCTEEREEMIRDAEREERERAGRAAWRKDKKPGEAT